MHDVNLRKIAKYLYENKGSFVGTKTIIEKTGVPETAAYKKLHEMKHIVEKRETSDEYKMKDSIAKLVETASYCEVNVFDSMTCDNKTCKPSKYSA